MYVCVCVTPFAFLNLHPALEKLSSPRLSECSHSLNVVMCCSLRCDLKVANRCSSVTPICFSATALCDLKVAHRCSSATALCFKILWLPTAATADTRPPATRLSLPCLSLSLPKPTLPSVTSTHRPREKDRARERARARSRRTCSGTSDTTLSLASLHERKTTSEKNCCSCCMLS